MSTELKLHRAIVHATDPVTGISQVKVPAIGGGLILRIGPEGLTQSDGLWDVPEVGSTRMVAITSCNTEAMWVGPTPNLDIPDGSITTSKLADGAVTTPKLQADAIRSSNYEPPPGGWPARTESGLSSGSSSWADATIYASEATFTADDVGREIRVGAVALSGPPEYSLYPFEQDTTVTAFWGAHQIDVADTPDPPLGGGTSAMAYLDHIYFPSVNPSTAFAEEGTFLDLTNGNLISKGLVWDDSSGAVKVRGDEVTLEADEVTLEATEVTITADNATINGKPVMPVEQWLTYTPTLANWTLGNGSLAGRYLIVGKVCYYMIQLSGGTTTSASGIPTFALPVPPATWLSGWDAKISRSWGSGSIQDATAASTPLNPELVGSSVRPLWHGSTGTLTYFDTVTPTAPFSWAVNDMIHLSGWYPID